MKPSSGAVQALVWGFLAAVILAVGALYLKSPPASPQASPKKLVPYSVLRDFNLTNQLGERVTLADLKGKVWIADIIFTRCGGICPKMTASLALLQQEWKDNPNVRMVTLTTDPSADTPAVMKKYAEHFGADPKKWLFLTGSKEEIVALAVDGLKLTALDNPPESREKPEDLFIHSSSSVVIDKQGRAMGNFEILEPDFKAGIVGAVNQLLREN